MTDMVTFQRYYWINNNGICGDAFSSLHEAETKIAKYNCVQRPSYKPVGMYDGVMVERTFVGETTRHKITELDVENARLLDINPSSRQISDNFRHWVDPQGLMYHYHDVIYVVEWGDKEREYFNLDCLWFEVARHWERGFDAQPYIRKYKCTNHRRGVHSWAFDRVCKTVRRAPWRTEWLLKLFLDNKITPECRLFRFLNPLCAEHREYIEQLGSSTIALWDHRAYGWCKDDDALALVRLAIDQPIFVFNWDEL